jgi:hypothetical protein
MKVKIKRWHGVAIWKWGIDEEVCGFQFWLKYYMLFTMVLIHGLTGVRDLQNAI